jgi:hypothetical protein
MSASAAARVAVRFERDAVAVGQPVAQQRGITDRVSLRNLLYSSPNL